jgi:hypothetical protein
MKRKKEKTDPTPQKEEKPIRARAIYREDAKRTKELLIWLLQLSRSGQEL